jgi:signal transduction histidine kinase
VDIYQAKRRWKWWLAVAAAGIILTTLLYTQYLVNRIASEESKKAELWAQAIQNRAQLISATDSIFSLIASEEQRKISLWAEANKYISSYEGDGDGDFNFATKIISGNNTIPVIIINSKGEIINYNNFPEDKTNDTTWLYQQLEIFKSKHTPIDVSYRVYGQTIRQYLYFDDSYIFQDLKQTINNLDKSFISETVINSASVPVIFTNERKDSIISFGNIDKLGFPDTIDSQQLIEAMKDANMLEVELSKGKKNYIFYKDSYILSLLKYFPFVFLALIAGFLLVAYLLFSVARRSEQNQVWVGMSKETAHQLGTPLSSLIGWLEILKLKNTDPEAIAEIEKDIERLQTITERFSKIGSTPELHTENLDLLLTGIIEYMKKRTSSKIEYIYSNAVSSPVNIQLNKPLFEWVFENLFRNSIDAIQGKGYIKIEVSDTGKHIAIDVTDSGKGIPQAQFKSVFRPGFTTKKRGWGLGLSLVKRIIEDYHRGKIFIKHSEIGVGTTFRILLKLN